jgi:hypothetical protein
MLIPNIVMYRTETLVLVNEIYMPVSKKDSLCGLVAKVPGYRSRGQGSIPGATRFSEK